MKYIGLPLGKNLIEKVCIARIAFDEIAVEVQVLALPRKPYA